MHGECKRRFKHSFATINWGGMITEYNSIYILFSDSKCSSILWSKSPWSDHDCICVSHLGSFHELPDQCSIPTQLPTRNSDWNCIKKEVQEDLFRVAHIEHNQRIPHRRAKILTDITILSTSLVASTSHPILQVFCWEYPSLWLCWWRTYKYSKGPFIRR